MKSEQEIEESLQRLRENSFGLILSDSFGIYIPQMFSEEFSEQFKLSDETKEILSDPENEWYWDEWNMVLTNSEYHQNGKSYFLHQDGDLWLINRTAIEEWEEVNGELPESFWY